MLFTKASEYALLSLIFIAKKDSPQDVDTISKELDISKSFLAKILQNLAKAGILVSYKGANGGFMLAKQDFNLKEIISKTEKHAGSVFECSKSKDECEKSDNCQIWNTFNTLQNQVDDFLETIFLKDIIKEKIWKFTIYHTQI